MQLQHEFTVPVEPATAWDVLLDVEAIAPCMPGATLGEVTGDEFTGTVKVRVGPVSLTYAGAARFTAKDDAARRVVIEAAGKDRRGGGTASATVTATLHEEGPRSTRVVVDTDLAVSGKPAQFGRGMLADVGGKLIGQFADCLAAKIAAGEVGSGGAGAGPSGGEAADPAGQDAAADSADQPPADPAVQPAAEPAAKPAGPPVAEQPPASDGQVRVSMPAAMPASTIRAAQEIDLLAVGLIPKWAGYAAAGLAGLLVGIVVDRLVRRG